MGRRPADEGDSSTRACSGARWSSTAAAADVATVVRPVASWSSTSQSLETGAVCATGCLRRGFGAFRRYC